jgi:hypothetical protein
MGLRLCTLIAKSQAIGLEGHRHRGEKEGFRQQITFDLDEKDITAVWNICQARLKRVIQGNGTLKAFKGFQFFVNSKGSKHRVHSRGFSELMEAYKEKVTLV